MKRIIETDDGGLIDMMDKKVALFCGVYIYTGKLVGVNADHVELAEPKLVYETGPLTSGPWKDAQDLLAPWRVLLQSVESWGPAKC
jgi:hypothetical protein